MYLNYYLTVIRQSFDLFHTENINGFYFSLLSEKDVFVVLQSILLENIILKYFESEAVAYLRCC